MLVIISDLHLNDGTTGKTVSTDAFVRFRGRLQELAYYASYRADKPGSYKPLERLDLLLLGDVLDVIRSTQWSAENKGDANYARPWFNLDDDRQRKALAKKVEAITDAILAANADATKQLRRLAGEKPLSLPPATANGVPAPNVKRQPVATRIHYLVGNHDWFWVIDKPEFQAIRDKITQALGLANPPGPFPHDPLVDSDLLAETYAAHSVFARHGDIYDTFNFDAQQGRAAPSLGDAIVIDLMNQFPYEVRERLKDDIPHTPGLAGFLDGMDQLVNVRPMLMAPAWVQGLLRRHEIPKATADEVKQIWNEVADKALEEPYVQEQDSWSPFDTVDLLETTLRFTKLLSFHSLSELLAWIQSKIWGGNSSFAKYALEEEAFLKQQARYFVYGHTHHYEAVPLYTGPVNERPFDQLYFNSGTWKPLHEITRHKPREQNFIEYQTFTYLTFYKDSERKGRLYETWSGTLDG